VTEDRTTKRRRERERAAPEATDDGSRHSAAFGRRFRGATPLATGVVAAGVLAAVLLVIGEFTTVASVEVGSTSCEVIQDSNPELADRCELSGFERQPLVRTVLAAGILAMALGAGLGRSRPAAVALMVLGALALGLGLLIDLPVTRETGVLGSSFEDAHGQAGPGLAMEIAAGLLAIAAGAIALLRPRSPRRD
jgi:hypothetical protein